MRTALLALPLVLASAAGTAAENRNGWPSQAELARQFERIAFSSEFGGQYRAGRLIRWTGAVPIRLKGHVLHRFRTEVERHVAQLRRASGLDLVVTAAAEEGPPRGITIEFSTSRGGTSFDPEAPCRTVMWDSAFAIERVQIYITPYPDALRRHCIAEEITQALGLADDSALIADSIFNDSSSRQRAAPWDLLMVSILYHPALRPGMTRAEAMPRVRRIIAELTARAGTSSGPRR